MSHWVTDERSGKYPARPVQTRLRIEQIIALLRKHAALIEQAERGAVVFDFAGGRVVMELRQKLEG